MKKVSLLLIAIFFAMACKKEKPDEIDPIVVPNYIFTYIDGEMSLESGRQAEDNTVEYINIKFAEEPAYKPEFLYWNPRLHQEEIAMFNQISERNGDTEWNYPVDNTFYLEKDNVALANNYRSIHAVSDAAWDDKHPAGESLDDILQLGSYTFHEYIESGYKIGYEWGEEPYLYYTAEYPHKKPLDQLTEDDLRIIKYAYDRPLLHIYFLSTPTIDKEHTITLTMTTTDGKVQTASVKCKPVKTPDII